MNHPKISIIIPVYKAEQYLDRCITSIINQTFTEWELILIDDGSPDTSGVICNGYAEHEKRIKVIHKQNEGVASAREIGIQTATGDYSIHIDPDDWIEKDLCELLYNKAIQTNADMVICDFMMEYHNYSKHNIQKPKELDADIFLNQLLHQERHGSLCNKLIRTSLYHKYNLHFPKEMILWEDLYICCLLLLHQCKLTYVPQPLYHYDLFTNDNSMVRKTNIKGLQAQIHFCKLMEKQIPQEKEQLLYESKGITLVTAFRFELINEKQIRNLFPEIKTWYIKKYGKDYQKMYYYGLTQILKGHSFKYSKRKMELMNLFHRITNKLFEI